MKSDEERGWLYQQVSTFEKALIEEAFGKHGNLSDVARALGVSRQGLYKKMARLGIDRPVREEAPA